MIFLQDFKRECFFISKKPLAFILPLLFFVLVVLLFPLSISPDKKLLTQLGFGIIWLTVLLAHLLSLPHLFGDDHDNGLVDQLLIQPASLNRVLTTKILAHWLFFMAPMIVISPILALMLHASFFETVLLLITLLLGTPVICFQGAIVAAMCVSHKREGLLLAIVLLPLYIPILIFGTTNQYYFLGALLILAMAIGPSVIAIALRIGVTFT